MRQTLTTFSLTLALLTASLVTSAESTMPVAPGILPPATLVHPYTSEDMTYLFAAARYLNVQKEQGNVVISAMTALKARALNRKDFYKALEESRTAALKEWEETYLKTRAPLVPVLYKDLDERIQRCRDTREAAYTDWLGQPKKNPLALKSANKTFHVSLELEQRLLSEVAQALVVATRNRKAN